MARKTKEPSDYVASNGWREVHSWDVEDAHAARAAIVGICRYPTAELTDAAYAKGIASARAVMHLIIDEMDPTDLMAVYHLALPMFKVPRGPGIFDQIAALNTKLLALCVPIKKRSGNNAEHAPAA